MENNLISLRAFTSSDTIIFVRKIIRSPVVPRWMSTKIVNTQVVFQVVTAWITSYKLTISACIRFTLSTYISQNICAFVNYVHNIVYSKYVKRQLEFAFVVQVGVGKYLNLPIDMIGPISQVQE